MKRTIFVIISCFVLFGQVFAQNNSDETIETKNTSHSVSIKFYDKNMYYPQETDSNPILVHITIKNTGTQTFRFRLADDRMFSVDFNAYTIKNTQLAQTEKLRRTRTTSNTVYFREISLEPEEEYSFIENLKEYLDVLEPSIYYVDVTFYPELYKQKQNSEKSNRLTLEVRPNPSASSSTRIPVKENTAQVLERESLSPDKVVESTIIARQKSLWDQFFLYMDVEEMLKRTPIEKRKYNAASADERERMIDTYKTNLMQSKIDGDIVAIPEDFTIERTIYSGTEGSVDVLQRFNNRTFYEKKRYTYKLRLREGIWQIYDYTVVNLGTE